MGKMDSLSTLEAGLSFLKQQGIKLVNIGAGDLYEGNLKLVLGLIWTLIQHYQVQKALDSGVAADSSSGQEQQEEAGVGQRDALLKWINAQLQPYTRVQGLGLVLQSTGVVVTNFTSDWQNGKVLAALTDSLDRGIMDVSHLAADPLLITQEALEVCEDEFGFPHLVDAEDLIRGGDENSLMTYLAYFRLFQAQKKLARRNAVGKHSFALGPGVQSGVVLPGQLTSFRILARDRRNRPRTDGGDTIQVTVTAPDGTEIPCSVVDQQDGTYQCQYTAPQQVQSLVISVALRQPQLYKQVNQPIKDSPYRVAINQQQVSEKELAAARALAEAELARRLAEEEAARKARQEASTETKETQEEEDDEEEDEREESEVDEHEEEEEEVLPPLHLPSIPSLPPVESSTAVAAEKKEGEKEEQQGGGKEEPEPDQADLEKLRLAAEAAALKFAEEKDKEEKQKLQKLKAEDKKQRGDPVQLADGSFAMPDGLSIVMPYGSLRWGVLKLAVRYETKTQKVLVKLYEARKLLPLHGWSKPYSNPYVKMVLLPDPSRKTKQKTTIHKKTIKPVFNSKHVFHIGDKEFEGRSLEIAVWDRGLIWNSLLGHVLCPLHDIPKDKSEEETANWYALMPADLGGLNHSGSVEVKDTIKYPDGSVLTPDGKMMDTHGKLIPWDHRNPLPAGGRKRLKDSTIAMWDGTIMLPSGALTRADGNLRMPDSTIVKPRWMLEAVPFPRGATQAETFDFYVDGCRVIQPKASNTCLKHGVVKLAVRYHPNSKQIEIELMEARGLRVWRGNKMVAGGPREVQCELALLPKPQVSPAERKKLVQRSAVKTGGAEKDGASLRESDFPFQETFKFIGTAKPDLEGKTLRELKESTLHIRVFQARMRGRKLLGHLKFNLAAAATQPFQWHSVQPFSVHRPRAGSTATSKDISEVRKKSKATTPT
eukprot:gb/GEZN01000781.1/.p1 GENE.gb/GEZN01000781.1/~~gb/GEZN01000781.1/.p1  ORF type:complete len:1038 (+),score=265.86 gb/GEZN01000781.1/:305-3115(+)